MDKEKFITIPPGAIIPGSMPKFKIYILSPLGQHVLWAREGNEVTEDQIQRLSASRMKEVFVTLDEEFKYEEYLEDHLGTILQNQGPSDDQKAEIFSRVSLNVVKDAFENALGLGVMSQEALERTDSMVKNALYFITEARSLQALAKMIGHDYQTYTHATKVLWFTVAFLKDNSSVLEQVHKDYAGFDETRKKELLKQCGVGALLHDIGKAYVSQEILNKIDPLTSSEWDAIKRHPINSVSMLLDTEIPDFVKKAVLHHHEDFNGGGYPLGLEGLSISPLARVLRIIDVFDAMTSRRPYKNPLPPAKAVQIMVGIPLDDKPGVSPKRENRDLGMRRCFDEELLRKFITFLGHARLSE